MAEPEEMASRPQGHLAEKGTAPRGAGSDCRGRERTLAQVRRRKVTALRLASSAFFLPFCLTGARDLS